MELLKNVLLEWIKEILISGITSNLAGLFDGVNEKVKTIGENVGATPSQWNPTAFSMVESLSQNVIVPVASVLLAVVMTLELINMILEKNSFHGEIDSFCFFKWIFKSACAITIVSSTFPIVNGIFTIGQETVTLAMGNIRAASGIEISFEDSLLSTLETMDIGALFGLWIQSALASLTMWAVTICVFVIIYGRMIEIYLVTSLGPLPMAMILGGKTADIGEGYLKSLFALSFQSFLIMVLVGIYAALVGAIAVSDNITAAIWESVGYTVLLCFGLFKTGSLSKAIFAAR